jgi:hypothetical protein
MFCSISLENPQNFAKSKLEEPKNLPASICGIGWIQKRDQKES